MTDLSFALPGRWWSVQLTTPETLERSVRALARSMCGTDDTLATVRAGIREDVGRAAELARSAGADAFHFAAEVVPGVSVPLTLATYAPQLPPRLSTGVSASTAADALTASLRAADPAATVSAWTQGGTGVVRELRMDPPEDGATVTTPTLRASYWFVRHGIDGTRLMAFSAPVLWEETAEPLLELMDAVVSTVQWEPVAPASGAAVAGG